MRCWKSYFSADAELHVADLKESSLALSNEGFHVHVCDLGSPEALVSLATLEWDFIIDDASHFWSHQKLAFRHLFGSIKSGGIYIVEDLCTSFGSYVSSYNTSGESIDAATYFLPCQDGLWPLGVHSRISIEVRLCNLAKAKMHLPCSWI